MDKFQAACIEYAAAGEEVRRLGGVIGEHLNSCYAAQQHKAGFGVCFDHVEHLKLAYAMEWQPSDSGYGRDRVFVNHDDEVDSYLEEHCQHCLAAHKVIQERKAAKQRFGIAKRRISILGKAATKGASNE